MIGEIQWIIVELTNRVFVQNDSHSAPIRGFEGNPFQVGIVEILEFSRNAHTAGSNELGEMAHDVPHGILVVDIARRVDDYACVHEVAHPIGAALHIQS